MRRQKLRALSYLSIILIAVVSPVAGIASPNSSELDLNVAERFVAVVDNDMWGRPASDRNYTMGVSLAWFRQGRQEVPLLQDALEYVNRATSINTSTADKTTPTVVILANSAFTPGDIRISAPIYHDRPYASLLYFGVGYWTRKPDSSIIETQLQVGVLGTSIGREVQKFIHRRCCADRIPQGWDNQIGQGGAATFVYRAKRTESLVLPFSSGQVFGLYRSLGGEAGYMTKATAGAAIYYGATQDDYDNIVFGTTANPVSGLIPRPRSSGKGFSAWIDYEISGIFYNQLLQGAWGGTNNVTYRWHEIEPIVHKLNAGVELTFIPKLLGLWDSPGPRLYLTQSWSTRDIKRYSSTRHYWGGFVASFPM